MKYIIKNKNATVKYLQGLGVNFKNQVITVFCHNGLELLIADQSTPHEHGWFVYEGCELICGDVSSDYVDKIFFDFGGVKEVRDRNPAPAKTKPIEELKKTFNIESGDKSTKQWQLEEIQRLLEKSDEMLRRSVIKLYELQTKNEKKARRTMYYNNVGFNCADGSFLSSIASLIKRGYQLTDKQIYTTRKRMRKYCAQLTRIANEQVSAKENYIRSNSANDYSASAPWNAPGMAAKDFI
jgi:hypothetical protein